MAKAVAPKEVLPPAVTTAVVAAVEANRAVTAEANRAATAEVGEPALVTIVPAVAVTAEASLRTVTATIVVGATGEEVGKGMRL